MKMTKKAFLVLSLAACAFAADAEKMPYEPYETIIERQMFGPLPDDFDPTKLPSEVSKSSSSRGGKTGEELTKEEQQLKSAINFSMINVTPDGEVKVGFTDNSDKQTPRNYYMGVGEELDGWLVKEANPSNATMTVVKGEIEVTLKVGGDSAKSDGATKKSGSPAPVSAVNGTTATGGPRSTLLLNNRLNRNRMSKREMAERLEAVEKDRAKERAEREAEREREKAEAEARRKQEQEDLKNELRQMVLDSKASRAEAKAVPEPASENSEETNNENNDAE